jgi:hypothetical protein
MPIHGYPGNVITANPTAPTSSVATGVWTTEQQLKAVAAGNWPFTIPTQQVSRSLRFNTDDSTYLSRSPASAGNQKTWTWSTWVKPSRFASQQPLFNVYSSATNYGHIAFSSSGYVGADDTLKFNVVVSNANQLRFETSALYRDPSAWYHVVIALDTTQATNTNRVKIYVNGSQVTAFIYSTYPTQNLDVGFFNTTNQHQIGALATGTYGFFSGYMAEMYFIDGQALTPSSFGRTNTATGVWEPLAYTGTYGTNGFYLNFSDNSGTTSTTLGKDSSGNGNNWTPNNFSVTAGAGNDSLVDSPTSYGTDTGVGGEVRGNYCTLTPLVLGSLTTLSNGNLQAAFSNWNSSLGTMAFPTTGKWYYEVLVSSTEPLIGIAKNDSLINSAVTTYFTQNSTSYGYYTGGSKHTGPGNSSTSYGASFTSGDLIGVALDSDNGTLTFYKNGSSQGTAFTSLVGPFLPVVGASNGSLTVNFGQRAFAYTAPSGFKALCTQNLPTPTIGATSTTQANDYFDVTTYSGSASSQSITNSGSMQPDFVWIKCRNTTDSHNLTDAVRGTNKNLFSNSTAAEDTVARLTSFNSNGVTLAGGYGNTNNAGQTYVAWQWRASNAAGVTNTAGTITSTVSANTTSGFSIVTATLGAAGVQGTVGHGLGVAPSMIIFKTRSGATYNWAIYHASVCDTTSKYFRFTTDALQTYSTTWGAALPTSTVFGVTGDGCGSPSNPFVAYCFAPVAGYSAFGSYTGNGSTDGPFVYTGFRPEYVMVKNASATGDWFIYDAVRNTYNVADTRLYANLSDAEATGSSAGPDILSNGFKMRFNSQGLNGNGNTIIYMAFAESPFKYSLAR